MTPDEKRIAIAEACGWVWYRTPRVAYETCEHRCLFLPKIHEYEGQSAAWLIRADGTERICNMAYMEREGHLPNYLEDANAACWAAAELGKQGWFCVANMGRSGSWECFFTKRDTDDVIPRDGDHYGAGDTLAAAITEAFLRTIGKLKD